MRLRIPSRAVLAATALVCASVLHLIPAATQTVAASPTGGRVQHHPRVYLLFWGGFWSPNDQAAMNAGIDLFQHTSGNGWTNILAQYNDTTDQIHPDASLADSWFTSDGVPSNIDPTSVENEIQHAISVRGWVKDPDSQFIVWPEYGATYNYASFGISDPSKACAWHSITPTIRQVYAVVPHPHDTSLNCHQNWTTPQNMTGFSSHEFAEAASDPDGNGQEIADPCAGMGFTPGPNGEYVAYLHSNASNSCVSSFTISYNSQYIAQHAYGNTYPYMSPEHRYPWWVQVKNTGNVPWGIGSGGQVRLGTTGSPNRCSAFDDGSWMSCGRIALSQNISAGNATPVLPGQIGEFDFTMTPPSTNNLPPGNYTENFQVVAEGYAWIGGGIWWALTVGSFHGEWAGQMNTLENIAISGSTYVVSVTFRNTGDCPWYGGDYEISLGTSGTSTNQLYRHSDFQAPTWPNWYTAANMDPSATEIDPGSTYTFTYEISVPLTETPGFYNEYFDLNAAYIGYFTNSGYNLPLDVV